MADIPSEHFALVVRFTVRPGAETEFDALIADTVRQIAANEPGTLLYVCHSDRATDGPPARVFYELYEDRAAFEEHERQPHVRHFLSERDRFVQATNVTFLTLDVAAGVGETRT